MTELEILDKEITLLFNRISSREQSFQEINGHLNDKKIQLNECVETISANQSLLNIINTQDNPLLKPLEERINYSLLELQQNRNHIQNRIDGYNNDKQKVFDTVNKLKYERDTLTHFRRKLPET
jgi:chromosome segregation ATPase